jgi:hypothetical protein
MEVPTFLLTLMQAKAVPDCGLGQRSVCVRRARMCLFDGSKFVGNAVLVDTCQPDPKKPWNWAFAPSAVRPSTPPQLTLARELSASGRVLTVHAPPERVVLRAARRRQERGGAVGIPGVDGGGGAGQRRTRQGGWGGGACELGVGKYTTTTRNSSSRGAPAGAALARSRWPRRFRASKRL